MQPPTRPRESGYINHRYEVYLIMAYSYRRFLATAIINGLHRSAKAEQRRGQKAAAKSPISSQLAAQLYSKNAALELCQVHEKLWYFLPQSELSKLSITVRKFTVLVELEANSQRFSCPQGFKISLDKEEFLFRFACRSISKAENLSIETVGNNIWAVSSFSAGNSDSKHTVYRHANGTYRCDCMLFRCLGNRIQKEDERFYRVIQQSEFFNGAIVCHHIEAVRQRAAIAA